MKRQISILMIIALFTLAAHAQMKKGNVMGDEVDMRREVVRKEEK